MPVIDRPETHFDGPSHSYKLEGDDVLGVSTVAKVGGFEETFGIASAWGFRIGYEGANTVASGNGGVLAYAHDELRAELQRRGLTPWSTRDKAAERGNWVHDDLEALAQGGKVPSRGTESDEIWGHRRGLLQWFLDYRPEFVATEVQVASRLHRFAGRYDVRCLINAGRLLSLFEGHDTVYAERVRAEADMRNALCLVDLKTSKSVYPLSHFPQLIGYEIASIEMGFPETDAQLVLNTHPDGTYDFVASWAEPSDFIGFLQAVRAIRRLEAADPAERLLRKQEEAIVAALPGTSKTLSESVPELKGLTGKDVGIRLGRLRKRGAVAQGARGVWVVVPASSAPTDAADAEPPTPPASPVVP